MPTEQYKDLFVKQVAKFVPYGLTGTHDAPSVWQTQSGRFLRFVVSWLPGNEHPHIHGRVARGI